MVNYDWLEQKLLKTTSLVMMIMLKMLLMLVMVMLKMMWMVMITWQSKHLLPKR